MLEARAQLEPAVARLAAARAQRDPAAENLMAAMEAEPVDIAVWNTSDRLFHRQLAAMTGNPVLLAFADHVASLMDQPLWQRLRDDSIAEAGRTRLHVAEHRMIYEAIVAGDAEAAAFYSLSTSTASAPTWSSPDSWPVSKASSPPSPPRSPLTIRSTSRR